MSVETDKKIERIMKKYNISGDIGFDETVEHFWKRKFIELHASMEREK